MIKFGLAALLISSLSLTSCGSKDSSNKEDTPPTIDLATQAPETSPVYGFWENESTQGRSMEVSLQRIKIERGAISAIATCGFISKKVFSVKAVASVTPETIEILENKKETVKHEDKTCRLSLSKSAPIRYALRNKNETLTLTDEKNWRKN